MISLADCSPFPSEKIAHGGDGKIDHVVHAAGVNSVNHRAPFIASSPVRIESGEVQGRIACECVRNKIRKRRQETATQSAVIKSDKKGANEMRTRIKQGRKGGDALSACQSMLIQGVPEAKMALMPMPAR